MSSYERNVTKELQKKIDELGAEILHPQLPSDVTELKRWQRHTLMSVLQYANGNEEAIELNKILN